MRDYQKSKVYKWEDTYVGPQDTNKVSFDVARAIVNHIWANEGLKYPPEVRILPAQTRRCVGFANRLHISLQPNVHTWIVLHELAHSLNSTIDDVGDGHGPNYVGIYMKLLAKYMNMNLPVLMHTAKMSGVDFNMYAVPGPLR